MTDQKGHKIYGSICYSPHIQGRRFWHCCNRRIHHHNSFYAYSLWRIKYPTTYLQDSFWQRFTRKSCIWSYHRKDFYIPMIYDRMRTINKIVVHHTAVTQSNMDLLISSINNNHRDRLHPTANWFGNHIAYHYVIWVDGEVRHTRPLDEIWYHASNWPINQTSIGICMSWNFDIESPSTKQYKACFQLISDLKTQFWNLDISGHNEFSSKTCPGLNFSFYELYNALMLFYEKLRRDNYEPKAKNSRMFKDPDAFIDRIKDLSSSEKFTEMTFLIAILAEKLWDRDNLS